MIQTDLNSRSQYRQMWEQCTDQEMSLSSALTAFLQFQNMFKIRSLAQVCLSLSDSTFHQESETKGLVHNSWLIPSHRRLKTITHTKQLCNECNVCVSPAGKLVLMSKQNRVILSVFPNKVTWSSNDQLEDIISLRYHQRPIGPSGSEWTDFLSNDEIRAEQKQCASGGLICSVPHNWRPSAQLGSNEKAERCCSEFMNTGARWGIISLALSAERQKKGQKTPKNRRLLVQVP